MSINLISLEKNDNSLFLSHLLHLAHLKSLPQALLFIGPHPHQITKFTEDFIKACLCPNEATTPCQNCQSCRWIQQHTHPDVDEITLETGASTIRVDQIRALQQDIYHTPKIGHYRFIIISLIEQLNTNAANALLKILEEPPKHIIFILIATHSKIAPTLLSRCQRYYFSKNEIEDYLHLGASYPEDSDRYAMFQARDQFISTLLAVMKGELDICSAAVVWQSYALEDIIWFFYLLTATLIQDILRKKRSIELEQLIQCLTARYRQPMHLYVQLDLISEYMLKVQQNISLNSTLVIETILLGYFKASHVYQY